MWLALVALPLVLLVLVLLCQLLPKALLKQRKAGPPALLALCARAGKAFLLETDDAFSGA